MSGATGIRIPADPHAFPGAPPARAGGTAVIGAFVFCMTVLPAGLSFTGGVAMTLPELFGLLMGLWLLCAHMTNTLGVAKGRSPVRTAVVLFAMSLLLTYGYAASRYLPPDEVKGIDRKFVAMTAFLAVALFVCDGMRTREQLNRIIRMIVLGVSFIGFVAALQFFVGLDLTQYLQNVPGLGYPGGYYDPAGERSGFRRVAGTTGSPIELGVACAMALPLALYCAMRARERGELPALWWGCCLIICMTTFYALSRSAMLGLAVVSVVLFASWTPRMRLVMVGVGLAFLVVLKFLIPGLLTSIFDLFAYMFDDSSVQYRTHDYPTAFKAAQEHILLGRGVGTWFSPKYQVLDNQYLQMLVEAGVLGVLALVVLFGTAVRTAVKVIRSTTDPELRALAVAVTAALLVPMIGSVTFDLLAFATVAGLTFLLIGFSGALLRLSHR